MPHDSEALSPRQVLAVLRRRLPVIVLCVVVSTVVAYGLSKHQASRYTATASLTFDSNSLGQELVGLPAVGSTSSALLAQQATNLELVKIGDMAAKTAATLGHGLTAEAVTNSVNVEAHGESSVITVAASARTPVLAARIANTYAREFVADQQRSNRHFLQSALSVIKKQLAALSPQQRIGADGIQLQNRAQTLGLLAEIGYGNVHVGQEASPPSSPSAPKTSKNTAIGLILGLILGLGLTLVLERVDIRIRDSRELEKLYSAPLLGSLPKSSALARSALGHDGKLDALPDGEARTFRYVRARLRFAGTDRELRTVAIASPASGDGKSTIACRLAQTAAGLGSKTLLVEADLRTPILAERLGVRSAPGLADVLGGEVAIAEAIQSVDVGLSSQAPGATRRTLDLLVAGSSLPRDPVELLEGYSLDGVLEHARSTYDLVVIDTASLIAFSDALTLLTKVDGVIAVGRMNRGRRDAAQRLNELFVGCGARVLGVVSNGTKSTDAAGQSAPSRPTSPTPAQSGEPPVLSDELVPSRRA